MASRDSASRLDNRSSCKHYGQPAHILQRSREVACGLRLVGVLAIQTTRKPDDNVLDAVRV